MKTTFVSGAALLTFSLAIQAQPATTGFGGEGRTVDGYAIKERGPHHRIWERQEIETTLRETGVERQIQYTELETGMHYWENGMWNESREAIEILGDHALATKGAHKVIFKANFADVGVVDLLTPDQKRFRSHIFGLSYFNSATGESVLIAEPKECFGQVLPPNQVFFLDAFDDVVADVRYTVSKAGCEQDVIIRAQLPDPSVFGLNPDTTKLQVLTEFIESPIPTKRVIQPMRPGSLPDEMLDFGAMTIGDSKAFAIGDAKTATKVRVFKQWAELEGRTFLIEQLPLRNISAALQSLPRGRTASVMPPRKGNGENALLALKPFLPKRVASSSAARPMRLAHAGLNRHRGFVLDYSILSSATDFTFQADRTYYCTNTVNLSGTTRIEGGTVVKLSSSATAQVNISGDLVWATASYRPAIFTAKDDNSTGETISGSTGNPTGYYGGGLHIHGSWLGQNVHSNLCLFYLRNALDLGYDDAQQFILADAQFVKCNSAISLVGSLNANNVLFYKIATNFNSSAGESLWVGHHLTVDQCGVFNNAWKATINLTNSLLVAVTNLDTSGYYWLYTNQVALLASDTGIFQTTGGGAHYLAANSPYRNAGTTNLDASLLADLAAKTTYPPLAYTNITFPNYDTFYPMAQRDTDVPDLGYHYDALDYLVGGVDVNADTTFAPGTAVGWFRYNQGWYHAGHGIHVADTKTLTFDGQAESPCYFVHQTAVQENRIGYTTIDAGPGGITGWATTKANRPYLNLQFTRCAGLPIYRNHFRDDNGGLYVSANHCEFFGGGLGGYVSDAGFTNCLLDRTFVWFEAGNTNYGDVFAFRNCTMRGGRFSINRQSSTEGHIQTTVLDSAFDNTTVSTSDPHASNASLTRYDYNAYLTNASRTYPTGNHDVLVTNFNWQHGWLGDFYLPAGSTLINTGSVADAASVGLYHFTTVTNQVKETNSTVDIGYHYVALDTNNVPVDTDTGGVADYLEDPNGNGTVNGGETDWTSGHGHDDKDHQVNKHLLTPGYLRCEYRVDPWGVDAKDPWTGQQKPRLYWIVTSQRRAAKQVAYRILVASSPENLNANIGDMWDSGRVCSDQTIHVEYDPTQHQLQSGQRLWWKVKTWELFSGKASPWSTNAFFQMGLLNTNDWSGANWIGVNGYQANNPCPMFRSPVLVLTNQIKNATAYVSAKGVYELWMNGQKIGPNVLAPEWTDYNQRIQYQTFDVTTNLLSGTTNSANVVGAFTAAGWWRAGSGSYYGTPNPQFLLRLIITNADNSYIIVDSGTNWLCSTNGPIRKAEIFKGETYEATREGASADWTLGSYTPQYFTVPIATNGVVAAKMFAQPNDPIQVVQTLPAKGKWVVSSNATQVVTVFDLGQNMVGWSTLSLTNVAGLSNVTVYLDHGEALIEEAGNSRPFGPDNDNPVYFGNLTGPSGAFFQKNSYVLNAAQSQFFRPHFTYHGFRYVQVTAPPSVTTNLSLGSVAGWVVRSGVPATGSFWCSDTRSSLIGDNLVSRMMTNSYWSLQGNLQGVFTACTQREEREEYLFDEHVFSQTACYFADMGAFVTKWIRDIRDAQGAIRNDGGYTMYAPWDGMSWVSAGTSDPGCQVGGIVFPWRMYQNYADTRMLIEHYDSSQKWFGYLAHICTNQQGVWNTKAWGNDPGKVQISVTDWMQGDHYRIWGSAPTDWYGNGATMPTATSTWETWCAAWSAYSADTVGSMSRVLQGEALARGQAALASAYGDSETYYTDVAATIRDDYYEQIVEFDANGDIKTFESPWWSTQKGIWHSKSQGDCVSVLGFDMIPTERRPWVLTNMLLGAASVAGEHGIGNYNKYCTGSSKSSNHWSTGYSLTQLGMQELTRGGFTTNAYQLLLKEEFPSWLYMITNGSTTWWEGWNTYVSGSGTGYGHNGNTQFGSYNHLPFAAVAEWIWKTMVGINLDPGQPGYQNVIVKPEPGGGITNTFGSLKSIHGPIIVSWTNNQAMNAFSLDAIVPPNTTASIFIPSTNNLAGITESGMVATTALGVRRWYITNPPSYTTGATVFEVGSGSYRFKLTGN